MAPTSSYPHESAHGDRAREGLDPLERVTRLSEAFAQTAAHRDRAGGTPKAERDALRESGLLTLLVPKELGGLGASWRTILETVRVLARADGALAHVYGFQHLLLATARLFGTEAQWRPLFERTAAERWFWGNALNPLDRRTTLEARDGKLVLRGVKSFCSGAPDSDRLVVSAQPPGETRLLVATVPSNRAGVRYGNDWSPMGQRQTDSVSVTFEDVVVEENELLTTPGPLGSVFASLRPSIAQLTLTNVYLGIAEGAFAEARRFTHERARPWLTSAVERASEDPYVLHRYGRMAVALAGARALADEAALALDGAWAQQDALTAEGRGRCAASIAIAKVAATEVGLHVTSRMFDALSARAAAGDDALDRFWRNLRTHTLHDPVDHKIKEVGRFVLNDELPVPSFYS